mgnify:CR=1 FL=1
MIDNEILKRHKIKLSDYTQYEDYTEELLDIYLKHDGYNYDLNPQKGQIIRIIDTIKRRDFFITITIPDLETI